jgi:hypothetical protein
MFKGGYCQDPSFTGYSAIAEHGGEWPPSIHSSTTLFDSTTFTFGPCNFLIYKLVLFLLQRRDDSL